jgi:hypothetical protein
MQKHDKRRGGVPLAVWKLLCLLTVVCSSLAGPVTHAQAVSAEDIVRRANAAEKAEHWTARMVVKHTSKGGSVKKREGDASMLMNPDRREPMRLFHFNAPADIAGTTLLNHENGKAEDDIWLYLPVLSKTRRIASGNKKSSFIGTLFTFLDLASPKPDDYEHQLLREEKLEGADFYVIESKAKTLQVVEDTGYSKVISWINKNTHCAQRINYFDQQGKLLKEQIVSEFVATPVPGVWVAQRRTMKDVKNNEMTEIVLSDINVQAIVDPALFRPGALGSS